jgi:predicted MFS family arabinose efflux permease
MTTFPKGCLSTIDKVTAQIKQAGFVEAVLRQTRRAERSMSPLLFGVGGAAGMVIGGRLGDWKPLESVAALSLADAVFYVGLIAVIDSVAPVGAAMILWAFCSSRRAFLCRRGW